MFREASLSRSLRIAFGGSVAGLGLALTPALAQQLTPSGDTQTLERVEITGSSIKHIDAETALPVQVITRKDIEKTGATTVEQLMSMITSSTSAGGIVQATANGATTGGVSTASLRGLGGPRTLILIDGRRATIFGGVPGGGGDTDVDVNSIPVSAIERIEVLKDGASAIYGSDAIAGVINFIL